MSEINPLSPESKENKSVWNKQTEEISDTLNEKEITSINKINTLDKIIINKYISIVLENIRQHWYYYDKYCENELDYLDEMSEKFDQYQDEMLNWNISLGKINYEESIDGELTQLSLIIKDKKIYLDKFIPSGVKIYSFENFRDKEKYLDLYGPQACFFDPEENIVCMSKEVLSKNGGLAFLLHELGHANDPNFQESVKKLKNIYDDLVTPVWSTTNDVLLDYCEEHSFPEKSKRERYAWGWMFKTLRNLGFQTDTDVKEYQEYSREISDIALLKYKLNTLADISSLQTATPRTNIKLDKLFTRVGL